ncbi:MAG: citrate lyase acyl carrier protein [Synergistales bacterium]|nr:citrate lyase acyl carrier protein [Synergistales bacterium]
MRERTAQAGTLESSDCLVTVAASDTTDIDYRGANAALFGGRTRSLIMAILRERGIEGVSIQVQDQGALEPTLRARLETALDRQAAPGAAAGR